MIIRRGRYYWFDMRIAGRRVRQSLHTTERGLALARASELRDRLLTGSPADIGIKEFRDRYIEWAWTTKPASAKADEYRLDRLVALFSAQGITKLSEITPLVIEGLRANLKQAGRSTTTINRYFQLLRGMFYRAADWGMYDQPNPMKKVRFYREEPNRRLLTADEIKRIIAAADAVAEKPRSHLQRVFADIVRLCVNTGLRKSEILRLRWADVHGDEITVKGKGDRVRTIPLNAVARAVIDRQPRRNGYVFGAPPADLTAVFRRTAEKVRKVSGVADFHFHLLRHYFGTSLLAAGVDIVTIGSILGHSRMTTTLIYGHTDEKRKRGAVKRLDGLTK